MIRGRHRLGLGLDLDRRVFTTTMITMLRLQELSRSRNYLQTQRHLHGGPVQAPFVAAVRGAQIVDGHLLRLQLREEGFAFVAASVASTGERMHLVAGEVFVAQEE